MRYLGAFIIVAALGCMMLLTDTKQARALSGDSTVVGPTFAFGNISTSNYKIRANRPTDRVTLIGTGGVTITSTAKTATVDIPSINGVSGFGNYSSGVSGRFRSTFLTQTANPNLPNSQSMGALSTGIVKNTATTGIQSIASPGVDYLTPTGSGQALTLARVGSSTYSTVQDLQNLFHSAGYISGGAVSDAGSGNINVAAGTGLIRPTNSAIATVYYFDWPASNGLAIPSGTIRYIGVEYNSGTPQVTLRASTNWNYKTDFPLARVANEAGVLHIEQDPQAVGDHAANMIWREYETMPLAPDMRDGGLMLGETGTRNVTVSAGVLWDRLNRYSISSLNTSVSGSFDSYYRDGSGGWTKIAAQTQWPNTQYDNGSGVLQTLTAAHWANLWFYIETDSDVVMLYGQNSYTTLAAATLESPPASVPNRIVSHGRLIGRMIFLKSAATAGEVDSAFATVFSPSGVTNHANLSNLDYASSGHTGFVGYTGNTAMLDMGAYDITTTGMIRAGNVSSANTVLSVASGTSPNAARLNIGYTATSVNYYDANTQIFRSGSFSEGMRLTSGALLIGTTTNDGVHKLQVNGPVSATRFTSSIATGTAPFTVTSTTPVANLSIGGTATNLSGTPALPNGTTATTQSQGDGTTKIATNAYVDTGLSLRVPYSGATSDLNLGTHDYIGSLKGNITAVDTAAGTVTETLAGGTTTWVKTDNSANTVHIVPDGANTIMGQTSYDLTNQYESVTLTLIGTIYYRR